MQFNSLTKHAKLDLEFIAIITLAESLKVVESALITISNILLTKVKDTANSHIEVLRMDHKTKHQKSIESIIERASNSLQAKRNEESIYMEVLKNAAAPTPKFPDSPYYNEFAWKFQCTKERIMKKETEVEEVTNDLYSLEFMNYIMISLVPFLCIVTKILSKVISSNVVLVENDIENTFIIEYKTKDMNNLKNRSVANMCREVMKRNEFLVNKNKIQHQLADGGIRVTEKPYYSESASNPLVTELWDLTGKSIKNQGIKARKVTRSSGRDFIKIKRHVTESAVSKKINDDNNLSSDEKSHSPKRIKISHEPESGAKMDNSLEIDSVQDLHKRMKKSEELENGPTVLKSSPQTCKRNPEMTKVIQAPVSLESVNNNFKLLMTVNTFNNGLVEDPEYFQRWISTPTKIGRYNCGNEKCILVKLLSNRCELKTISINVGEDKPKRLSSASSIAQIKEPLCDIILMPYLFQFHWLLLVIDVECSALEILDPYEKQTDSETRMVEAFTIFIKSCVTESSLYKKLKNKKWTIKPSRVRSHQATNDQSNCGIYVAYYIECIGRGISMDENLVPAKLRREMARAIVRTSEDVKDCRLYCGKKKCSQKEQILTWNACKRWFHIRICVKVIHEEQMTNKKTCQLCKYLESKKGNKEEKH
ncbi:hypothetical protein KQX54_010047 [Cotesia glomerata]|uniref:Ubiquitin-like protease family profile domain-containing protein n=1 Tax=Cotesia glomerata TaxID=32391 RepID=A0AAV7HUS8_COTGL|nr:hypothetical protein KQX54_010047 [Cotesia glomerata]